MLVEDVMETDLVTADIDGSLRDAVGAMLEHRVGSVIVTASGNPTGIVTETDALQAGYLTEQPFDAIALERVMSDSLSTVAPTKTLRFAIQRMAEAGVKKLPVVEDLDLVGIVTMSDVTRHYGDIVREIHDLEHRRSRADGW